MILKELLRDFGIPALLFGTVIGAISFMPYVLGWVYNQGAYPTGVLVTYFDTPVMGLNVRASFTTWNHEVRPVAEGPTDQNGYFRFLGKPSIQYTIAITYEGTEFSKTLPGGAIWDLKLPVIIP